jgi:hypothetical protein
LFPSFFRILPFKNGVPMGEWEGEGGKGDDATVVGQSVILASKGDYYVELADATGKQKQW